MKLFKRKFRLMLIVILILNSISFSTFAEGIEEVLTDNIKQSIKVDTADVFDDSVRDNISENVKKDDDVEEGQSNQIEDLKFKINDEPEDDNNTTLFGAPAPDVKIHLYYGTTYDIGSPARHILQAGVTETEWQNMVNDASNNLPQGLTFAGFNDTISIATYNHEVARGLTSNKTKDEVLALWTDYNNGNITDTMYIGACYNLPVHFLRFTNDDTKGTYNGAVKYADEQKAKFIDDFNRDMFRVHANKDYYFDGWKRLSDGVVVRPVDLVWPHDRLIDWNSDVEYEAVYQALDHIEVKASPSTMDYRIGDTFNPAGMKITLYYGSVPSTLYFNDYASDFSLEPTVVDSTGKITIKFRGKETSLHVNIITTPAPTPAPAPAATTTPTYTPVRSGGGHSSRGGTLTSTGTIGKDGQVVQSNVTLLTDTTLMSKLNSHIPRTTTQKKATVKNNTVMGYWVQDPTTQKWYFTAMNNSTVTGFLANEWATINQSGKDRQYHFDKDGSMSVGWYQENGKTYYLSGDPSYVGYGEKLTGLQNINSQYYRFNENGELIQ